MTTTMGEICLMYLFWIVQLPLINIAAKNPPFWCRIRRLHFSFFFSCSLLKLFMEVDTTWNCNLWKPKRRRRRGNNNENSRGTLRPKRTKRDAKNIELKPNLQNSFLKQCSSQKYLNLLERLYSERFRKALYQRMWCTASTETPRVRPQRRKFVVIVMIDPYFYFKDLLMYFFLCTRIKATYWTYFRPAC